MMLTAVIADDEPVARKILREELEVLGGIELVGEAADGASAVQLVLDWKPDIVFLDLQMPEISGIEVARQIRRSSHLPVIIMVTAYDQFAIQALDAGAIDYLLKPVSQERLLAAVDRARRIRSQPAQAAEQLARIQEARLEPEAPRARRIVGRDGAEYVLLQAGEILAFQADGDLVWIITAKHRYLATQTLRALQERLRNSAFRRIHRNAMINIDHVRKMSTLSSQRWMLTLSNGMEFIVSRRQAASVRDLLSW